MAFGDASTLQINVTSVRRGAPTSWLGTYTERESMKINEGHARTSSCVNDVRTCISG